MALFDPLNSDAEARPWVEQIYQMWRSELGSSERRKHSADFATAWENMTDQERMSFYSQGTNQRSKYEAQAAAASSGAYRTGRQGRWTTIKQRVAQLDENGNPIKGAFAEVETKVWQEYDPETGQWVGAEPPGPLPHEIRMGAAQAKGAEAVIGAQLKDIETLEKMRPQREELLKRETEYKTGAFKRAEMERKLAPVKELFVEPATEIVNRGLDVTKSLLLEGASGMARGAASGLSYRKGAIEAGRKAFVGSTEQGGYRESPLRPAPRARFTTPMVTSIPSRMPITTTRSGKKIPAGEAVIAPAKMVKEAIIKPTVAGSLLTTSVGKMPAAQALVPQRPTRLGLSNLRVNVDTSGIRRGGALPRLKIKRNLYNDQLRRIRGLLR